MTSKYYGIRWCSPVTLKLPHRPARFLDRDDLVSLCEVVIDPDGEPWVPVFPDGEVIGDRAAATIRILIAMGWPGLCAHVVWIDCTRDLDFYQARGIDVVSDAYPELLSELSALTDQPAARPIKSSSATTWWSVELDWPKAH